MDYKYFRTVVISQIKAVVTQRINPIELFMKPINPIWMNLKMQKWFDNNLKKDMRVFEYGSGNSSKYIASKVKEIICVEDSEKWYAFNKKGAPKNMKIILAKNKMDYVNNIKNKGLFDIIIVDGNYRKECFESALKRLKVGGYLVFDNLERPENLTIFNSINGSKKLFNGLIPGQGGYCKTGIYVNQE